MKGKYLIALVSLVFVAGMASADSLTVNGAAAMGGTSYGLEVYHDNTDVSYVQDDSPTGETIYRFTFLFDVAGHAGSTINYRQAIFRAWGDNPNPGVGFCPADPGAAVPSIQLWLYMIGGSGNVPTLQIWSKGNQCGDQGAQRINISLATDVRVCGEWWTGSSSTGGAALAVVNPADPCPAHNDPAYHIINFSNQLTNLNFVRMGTPAVNGFSAGEIDTYYYDEFESYRTLAP
jgi:hypothetical protein